MAKVTARRIEECKTRLREILKPGMTVYTTLKHVSRSGMYRVIDLHVMQKDERTGECYPSRISGWAADLLEGYDRRHEGCRASGCGMDMGFRLVYNLSHSLFPDGYGCIGKGCPSNDHSNGDRIYTPHGTPMIGADSKGEYHHWHNSGGYALKHQWM